LPMEVQQVLATLGPKWGTALRENIEVTAAAFQPLLRAAPKDGSSSAKISLMARMPSRSLMSISRSGGLARLL